jgi:hypothetical protein
MNRLPTFVASGSLTEGKSPLKDVDARTTSTGVVIVTYRPASN